MIKSNVSSSNIDTIGYEKGDLFIRFKKNGRVYAYRNVSLATFFSLKAAESAGKFFNRAIKPHYSCEELSYDPFVA